MACAVETRARLDFHWAIETAGVPACVLPASALERGVTASEKLATARRPSVTEVLLLGLLRVHALLPLRDGPESVTASYHLRIFLEGTWGMSGVRMVRACAILCSGRGRGGRSR